MSRKKKIRELKIALEDAHAVSEEWRRLYWEAITSRPLTTTYTIPVPNTWTNPAPTFPPGTIWSSAA